jgi:hypothetical protein
MEYSYSLSIEHSVDSKDKITGGSTVWHNFMNYVTDEKRGSYRKHLGAELQLFNAVFDLDNSQILFNTEADRTMFLLKFA